MRTSGHSANQLLLLGAAQAVLFVAGALLGRWLGSTFGFDALGPGFSNNVMIGILFVGVGGGAGAQLARGCYTRNYGAPKR